MTKLMIMFTLPRVRPCREYLGLDLEAVLDEGPGHRLVPGVPGVHGGQALVSELHQELEVNGSPGIRQPASQPSLELLDVCCRGDPHVKVEDELVRDDIDLDPALAHGEVNSGHVTEG